MKEIEVVAAIIMHQGQVFCAQRNKSNKDYLSLKYEFPGGKIELNECQETALRREIREELSWNINIGDHFLTVTHSYPDFKIKMYTFLCMSDTLEFKLNEHASYMWLPIERLLDLDWAEADIPIVKKLMDQM